MATGEKLSQCQILEKEKEKGKGKERKGKESKKENKNKNETLSLTLWKTNRQKKKKQTNKNNLIQDKIKQNQIRPTKANQDTVKNIYKRHKEIK